MDTQVNSQTGKKVLYGAVIALSGLIILLNVVGIIGVWAVERPLSEAAVTFMQAVEQTAVALQTSIARVDGRLAALESATTQVADASRQLGQNVEDRGLVMVLLPEEREQQVVETANSVQETFTSVRESVQAGIEFYRALNRLPLVSLPGPDPDQVAKVQANVTQVQELSETIRGDIAAFRSGVSGAIGRVETAADRLIAEIQRIRAELAGLDARMAELEAFAVRLQQTIPGALLTIALILTLLLAYVIYTQVEVIRLFVARWQALPQLAPVPPAEPAPPSGPPAPPQPAGEGPGQPGEASLPDVKADEAPSEE